MSTDRLNELQRQRALAQEQVAWFDREIARESGTIAPPASRVPTPTPSTARITTAPSLADPERIIEQYQGAPTSIRNEVRRGCFLYTSAATVLLGLGLTALWFIFRR